MLVPSNLLIPIKKALDYAGFFSFLGSLLRPNTLGWVLSIWDSPTTILSPEGVVGPMGRNGGAQEMQLPIRNIASNT
jgi:hypothetical protein